MCYSPHDYFKCLSPQVFPHLLIPMLILMLILILILILTNTSTLSNRSVEEGCEGSRAGGPESGSSSAHGDR